MKKIIATTIAAGLVAGVASAAVSTTLDFASAYVFRGYTLNDGPVVQPGIEASGFGLPEEYGSIAVGAWANYDLDDYAPTGVTGSYFSETDWYGSYSLPAFVEGLDLFVGYAEYTYGSGSADKELNFGAGYEVSGFYIAGTVYKGVGGLIGTQLYLEGALGYGMDISETLSGSVDATFGYLDPDVDGSDSGFNDYTVGASLGYAISEKWSAGASVTYIGQGDDTILVDVDQGGGYDVDVVGMLSFACDM